MSVSVPVPCCFDYYSFVVQFEIRESDIASFVLLSQCCFGYIGFFCVSMEILESFVVEVKNAIVILIGIALNL